MTDGEVESDVRKVLLIDLENCPNKLNNLNTDLAEYSEVLICFTHGDPKIPLEWLNGLSGAMQTGKLRIQRMIKAGKNAADFGIAFHAGQMMARLTDRTHFEIISNDQDLDHVVNLLKEHGRSAERTGNKPADTSKSSDGNLEHLKVYCLHLQNHPKTRPAKISTLKNSITSKFKNVGIETDSIIKGLIQHSAIHRNGEVITYNDKHINMLLAQADQQK